MLRTKVSALLFLALLMSCREAKEFSPARYDPEALHSDIALVDAVIFLNDSIGPVTSLTLEGRLGNMFGIDNSRPQTSAALNERLENLRGLVLDSAPSGFRATAPLVQEWLAVRDVFFLPAAWFRGGREDRIREASPVDSLAEVLTVLLSVADGRGDRTADLALLNQIDSLLDSRRDFRGDQAFLNAWRAAQQSSRELRSVLLAPEDSRDSPGAKTARREAIYNIGSSIQYLSETLL